MLNTPALEIQQHVSQGDLKTILDLPCMDSWDSKVQYQRRTGFCCSLGHVERWNPETPARNFNDLVEIMGLFPEQFLQDDGTLCTMLMIVGDHSKVPLNKEYQFCMGILFLEYDFDLVLRISYAAYKSYRDPAEAGNGAIGRRTNGYPHQVDLAEYTTS